MVVMNKNVLKFQKKKENLPYPDQAYEARLSQELSVDAAVFGTTKTV